MNNYLDDYRHCNADLKQLQVELLTSRIISPNRESDYGKAHSFQSIRTAEQYRDQVPLVHYENIRPWVNRLVEGEDNVLTCGKTLAFVQTSGSLAQPKLIPVTTDVMRQKVGIYAAYWESIYQKYPAIRNGKLAITFSDSSEPETLDSGLQVFSESGFWAKRGRGLHSTDRWPLPPEVRAIKDPESRFYACARLMLQEDMTCIMCLNPSTLLYFVRIVEKYFSELAEGIRTGSWGLNDEASSEIVKQLNSVDLSSVLRSDPEIADRLLAHGEEQLSKGKTLLLKSLWETLDLVICWQSNVVLPYTEKLKPYLLGVAVRDYITQASECMMLMPLEDSTSGGVLTYTAHYYEFIPESKVEQQQPDTVFSWQLEPGKRYELVVSTAGGLYRYRTGDCMLVKGFHGTLPILDFQSRVGRTSSITGEKLTEFQILESVNVVCEQMQIPLEEYLCFPSTGYTPHYSVAIDQGEHKIENATLISWVKMLDEQLQKINTEYADKRASGRLGDMKVFKAESGQLRHHRIESRANGVSEEQVKGEVLTSELDLASRAITLVPISQPELVETRRFGS